LNTKWSWCGVKVGVTVGVGVKVGVTVGVGVKVGVIVGVTVGVGVGVELYFLLPYAKPGANLPICDI